LLSPSWESLTTSVANAHYAKAVRMLSSAFKDKANSGTAQPHPVLGLSGWRITTATATTMARTTAGGRGRGGGSERGGWRKVGGWGSSSGGRNEARPVKGGGGGGGGGRRRSRMVRRLTAAIANGGMGCTGGSRTRTRSPQGGKEDALEREREWDP
jgi:hypothetical protein